MCVYTTHKETRPHMGGGARGGVPGRAGGGHEGGMTTIMKRKSLRWKVLGACILSLSLVPFFIPLADDGRLPTW